jgi:diaminohydroxyphosphoribosylaminopyrimidine deaminase/5-amino-6-(5-phosphoribosylamino)uracil reductase
VIGPPASDTRYMALALTLGRRGLGCVWPNPAVGCVLVREGRIVARGWTQPGGRPHAEAMALAQAGEAARGATAFVSLEPCNHHGGSAPCTEALIDAGVARVVAAVEDPDPRVQGSGMARLAEAGVETRIGVLEDAARRAHLGFFTRVAEHRPMVTLKLATSLDGRIATGSGQSQWITGSDARRTVHAMRASYDAVLVGGGTARADDPSLTVRDLGIAEQPVRVVVSRRLDLPLMGKLARTAGEIPLWICHGQDADAELHRTWAGLGAKLLPCIARGGQLDPASVLQALGAEGLTRVFCEGGGSLAASLMEAGLVDRLVTFTAGLAIGAEGLPAVGALGVDRLDAAPRFALEEVRAVGRDAMQVWARV